MGRKLESLLGASFDNTGVSVANTFMEAMTASRISEWVLVFSQRIVVILALL